MKGGDPFVRESAIDTTAYCSSLKPKATELETMANPPFK